MEALADILKNYVTPAAVIGFFLYLMRELWSRIDKKVDKDICKEWRDNKDKALDTHKKEGHHDI